METHIDEIAPSLYRLSSYIAKIKLQFNQFLVIDDEPRLYHTGLRGPTSNQTRQPRRFKGK